LPRDRAILVVDSTRIRSRALAPGIAVVPGARASSLCGNTSSSAEPRTISIGERLSPFLTFAERWPTSQTNAEPTTQEAQNSKSVRRLNTLLLFIRPFLRLRPGDAAGMGPGVTAGAGDLDRICRRRSGVETDFGIALVLVDDRIVLCRHWISVLLHPRDRHPAAVYSGGAVPVGSSLPIRSRSECTSTRMWRPWQRSLAVSDTRDSIPARTAGPINSRSGPRVVGARTPAPASNLCGACALLRTRKDGR
jgi:hypothetical protein